MQKSVLSHAKDTPPAVVIKQRFVRPHAKDTPPAVVIKQRLVIPQAKETPLLLSVCYSLSGKPIYGILFRTEEIFSAGVITLEKVHIILP